MELYLTEENATNSHPTSILIHLDLQKADEYEVDKTLVLIEVITVSAKP